MYSPVRICQPTSASASKDSQPWAPALMNSQTTSAMNKRSARDGTSKRPQRCASTECRPLSGASLVRKGGGSASTVDGVIGGGWGHRCGPGGYLPIRHFQAHTLGKRLLRPLVRRPEFLQVFDSQQTPPLHRQFEAVLHAG